MKLYTTDEILIKETEDFPQNYTGVIIDQSGTKRWYKNGHRHRDEDLPSIIFTNGKECWYQNGCLHRMSGPAIKTSEGRNEYFVNGRRHREDGPAIISSFQEEWYINNKLHNKNGPAIVVRLEDGKINKEWHVNGKKHRLDGPAFEYEYFRLKRLIITTNDGLVRDMSDEEYDSFKKQHENKVLDCRMNKIPYTLYDIKVIDNKECLQLWYVDGKQTTKEACKLLSNMLKLTNNLKA